MRYQYLRRRTSVFHIALFLTHFPNGVQQEIDRIFRHKSVDSFASELGRYKSKKHSLWEKSAEMFRLNPLFHLTSDYKFERKAEVQLHMLKISSSL